MTPEQLLIKRYKCIAPIPFQPFPDMYNVGDIFTDNSKTAVLNQKGDAVCVVEWEKYPANFQPLPWWSDRKPEDLPEYVKFEDGKVFKILKWEVDFCKVEGSPYLMDANFFIPATAEEYEQWKQSKNK